MLEYEMKTSHLIALRAAFTILVAAALFFSAAAYKSATPTVSDPEFETIEKLNWHDPDASCYLVFAEVYAVSDGCTSFVTRDGNLYSVTGEYSPDCPYLLTMYDFHTADVTDDCVCVVWVCAEGALG